MAVAENKALVRRYLEEVVNTGDVDRLAEFIAPTTSTATIRVGGSRVRSSTSWASARRTRTCT